METSSKTVFISYAHEPGPIRQQVAALAAWLQAQGVRVIYDGQHANRPPPVGWVKWMEHGIEDADVVLLVCTPRYKKLFSGREVADGGGRGVGWEGAIVSQVAYGNLGENHKFFPVLPVGGSPDDIPRAFQAYDSGHHFPGGNERILSLIHGDCGDGLGWAAASASSSEAPPSCVPTPAPAAASLVSEVLPARLPSKEAPGQPPAWALRYGRDREGFFALAPNPWGAPVRVAFPRPAAADEAQQLWWEDKPQDGEGLHIDSMTLELDRIGLSAGMTLNGWHRQVFRYIAPGRFLMGSAKSEIGRDSDEGPQHWVTLSQGIWMADTACSQGLWQAVMGANPSNFHAGNGGGPEHPVEMVSWDMAQGFLQRLQTVMLSCIASLPTEAEWEYACRAGTSTPFSFGATVTPDLINYNDNHPYGNAKQGEYRARTVAVKALPANAWGLHQMHGNVWEWCADGSRKYGSASVADPGLAAALTPAALEGRATRVLRGGSWINDARDARSAYRNMFTPVWLDNDIGFRVALRSNPGK